MKIEFSNNIYIYIYVYIFDCQTTLKSIVDLEMLEDPLADPWLSFRRFQETKPKRIIVLFMPGGERYGLKYNKSSYLINSARMFKFNLRFIL